MVFHDAVVDKVTKRTQLMYKYKYIHVINNTWFLVIIISYREWKEFSFSCICPLLSFCSYHYYCCCCYLQLSYCKFILLSQNQLEAKKTFVRYISHEIRTPLNVVLVGLQMLEKLSVQEERKSQSKSQSQSQSQSQDQKKDKTIPDSLHSPSLSITKDSLEACHVAVNILNELLIYDHRRRRI